MPPADPDRLRARGRHLRPCDICRPVQTAPNARRGTASVTGRHFLQEDSGPEITALIAGFLVRSRVEPKWLRSGRSRHRRSTASRAFVLAEGRIDRALPRVSRLLHRRVRSRSRRPARRATSRRRRGSNTCSLQRRAPPGRVGDKNACSLRGVCISTARARSGIAQ